MEWKEYTNLGSSTRLPLAGCVTLGKLYHLSES